MNVDINNIGKGIYIWNIDKIENGNIEEIVGKAKVANFNHVLIKIANGTVGWNWVDGVDKAAELSTRLKEEGIQPWGWHYLYGNDPKGEASTAKRRVENTGVVGYVIDAEGEYKGKNTSAVTFMNNLDISVPIALGTYRYPSMHPELPWKEIMNNGRGIDLMMPQVYWMKAHNPAQQVRETLLDYEGHLNWTGPFALTGSAFDEWEWTPTNEDLFEFINEVKAQGIKSINFWNWKEMKETRENGSSFWKDVIRDFEWSFSEPSDPATIETRVSNLEDDLLSVENKLITVTTGLDQNTAKITEIKNGISEIDNLASIAFSQSNSNAKAINRLEESISSLEQDLRSLINSLNEDVETLSSEQDNIKNSFQEAVEGLVARIIGVRQTAEESLDAVQTLKNEFTSFKNQMEDHTHEDGQPVKEDCGWLKKLFGEC